MIINHYINNWKSADSSSTRMILNLSQEIETVDKEYHPFIISNRKDSLNTLSVYELVQICTHFNHNNHDTTYTKLIDIVTDNLELWIITHILKTVQQEYNTAKTLDEKHELVKNKIQELYTNNFINNKHLFSLFLVMNFQDETCIGEWLLCTYKSDNFLHTLNELLFTGEHKNQFWKKISDGKSQKTHKINQNSKSIIDLITNDIQKN